MPYIKRTVRAGKTIEIYKYFSSRYGRKGIKRGKNENPTPEEMQKINERRAEEKLRHILNENFGMGDIHLVIGYRRGSKPEPEEARKHLDKLMRGLRKYFREKEDELRYVTVTEYKRARIHHHMVIPDVPPAVLYQLWPYGRPHITPLDGSGQYGDLAAYLIKETAATYAAGGPYGKRWNASKNLRRPQEKVEVVRADSWTREPRPIKNYYVEKESVRSGTHKATGYEYQFYRMIRLQERKRAS